MTKLLITIAICLKKQKEAFLESFPSFFLRVDVLPFAHNSCHSYALQFKIILFFIVYCPHKFLDIVTQGFSLV